MIFLGGCAAAPASVDQTTYWPAHDWRTSTPEEQGLDSTLILAMLQEIQTRNLRIHSLLIIRHGYLVTEVYFPPYQREFKHPLFSMTKSVTSALVGKALQEGRLKDIQQKVLDFFPDIAREVTDPRVKDLTLEHLLTMSAGFNTNTMPDLSSKAAADGTIEHILTYDSILAKPGTSFYYDSGLPHLLSAIIQKTTGLTLQEYAQQKLFDPLGISNIELGRRSARRHNRQHRLDAALARPGKTRLSLSAAWPVEWNAGAAGRVGDRVHPQTDGHQGLDECRRRRRLWLPVVD